MARAAIYHFTDGSEVRPIYYEKELTRIRGYAESIGYLDVDVYVDKTLRKCEQTQLKRLTDNAGGYKALILKDFYHLRKNTGACMAELLRLSRAGTEVHTVDDGSFCFTPIPDRQRLNVAAYYCGLEITEHSPELQHDIMESFVRSKTDWTLKGFYADLSGNKVDGNQQQLARLIEDRDQYDIVLVQTFLDIHWRTSKFCKIRHLLQKDIYSMQDEIFLPYRKEKKDED